MTHKTTRVLSGNCSLFIVRSGACVYFLFIFLCKPILLFLFHFIIDDILWFVPFCMVYLGKQTVKLGDGGGDGSGRIRSKTNWGKWQTRSAAVEAFMVAVNGACTHKYLSSNKKTTRNRLQHFISSQSHPRNIIGNTHKCSWGRVLSSIGYTTTPQWRQNVIKVPLECTFIPESH